MNRRKRRCCKKRFSWGSGTETIETFDSDYQTYIDALSALAVSDIEYTPPPQNIRLSQDKFVKTWKISGLWSRTKTWYFFHSGGRKTGLINLKNPATYTNTFIASTALQPIQIENTGTRFAVSYISQPFKSNEYAGIHTDLTMIQIIPKVPFSELHEATYSQGMRTAATGNRQFMTMPFYDATNVGYSGHSSASFAFPSTKHEGVYISTYNGTQQVMYKDGTKYTNTVTPTVPTDSLNRFIGGYNNNGTRLGAYGHFIAADILLDQFNDADAATALGIINTYIDDITLGENNFIAEYASHCWFARERAMHDPVTNKSWIGQVHADAYFIGGVYSQFIFQIDNNTNVVTKFRLGTVGLQDDHDEPSMILRASDNRILAAYTEHSVAVIRWRISTNPKDITAWGAEQTIDPDGAGDHDYTYPSVFQVVNGDIYIFFRDAAPSGAALSQWSFIKSTDNGVSFGSYTTYSDFTYSNAAQDPNDMDIIHFVVSEHPGDGDDPNQIATFYFDAGAGTFHKTDGTDITASIPITAADATIIQSNALPVQCWIEDIMIDPTGKPRVLFNLIPDEFTSLEKDEYYSEWNGTAWTTPHLLHRASTHYMETELLQTLIASKWYAPLGTFDRGNIDRIFSSKEVLGDFGLVCEIFELTRISHDNFTSVQRTFNSQNDQWRPISINSPTNNVFWLDKVYYDHWLGLYYQTLVMKTL